MLKNVFLFLFVILCVAAVQVYAETEAAPAKEKAMSGGTAPSGEVVAKANKARGEGKDPNIKVPADNKNDPNNIPKAPPEKGGEKSRGGYCDVGVKNYTGYKIQIYYGGDYMGVMPAWGSFYVLSTAGTGVLYGRADFTDGSYLTFGPQTFSCPSGGSYVWSTYP